MMQRRGFLGAMLAAAAAPAYVRADSLMRIVVPQPAGLILYGDGIHDDTDALQGFIEGAKVYSPSGLRFDRFMSDQIIKISSTIVLSGKSAPTRLQNSRIIGDGMRGQPIFRINPGATPHIYDSSLYPSK